MALPQFQRRDPCLPYLLLIWSIRVAQDIVQGNFSISEEVVCRGNEFQWQCALSTPYFHKSLSHRVTLGSLCWLSGTVTLPFEPTLVVSRFPFAKVSVTLQEFWRLKCSVWSWVITGVTADAPLESEFAGGFGLGCLSKDLTGSRWSMRRERIDQLRHSYCLLSLSSTPGSPLESWLNCWKDRFK